MKGKRYLFGLMAFGAMVFLQGCDGLLLLDPKGPIGDSERFLIVVAFALMLIVVIPVFIMGVWFPWKYRASNKKASYKPKWDRSIGIEWSIWLVPIAIVSALSLLAWTYTFKLDPYKPLDSDAKPVTIEAVSLDWKWMFIYPDQQIATVNELAFPANVPLSFRITSDTVMTSFFIPQLGSQIYAMAGMETRLHLLAHEPGVFVGQNQQFSGNGYADMRFNAIATASREEFDAWIQKVKQSPDTLDQARYEELRKPTAGYPVTYYSSVSPDLFEGIIGKYMSNGKTPGYKSEESAPARKTAALED